MKANKTLKKTSKRMQKRLGKKWRRIVEKQKAVTFILFLLLLSLLGFVRLVPQAQAFNPNTDIFFEYGAESGVLQPPWDVVGAVGSGDTSGSKTTIVTTPVRTGTQSMKFYQIPPPKSDAQGRVVARYYNTQGNDLYLSWWIWIPNIYPFNSTGSAPSDRFSFAGFTTWFGPSSQPYKYWTGVGISCGMAASPPRFLITRRFNPPMTDVWDSSSYLTQNEYNNIWKGNDFDYAPNEPQYYIYNNLEQWIHFQIHYKWAQDTSGEVQVWINNNVVMNVTGIKTDPRGYSGWGSKADTFSTGYDTPMINLGLHHDEDNPEAWIFIDDVVLGTAKVPEAYGVGGVSQFERWENGFEDGDDTFPLWNGTSLSNGEANISSTIKYQGSYSANLTTLSGTSTSYARIYKIFTDRTYVFLRAYVYFDDLPDTDTTAIFVLRIANSSGYYIGVAGVRRSTGSYYWTITLVGNQQNNTLDASISPDTWYNMEFFINATSSGYANMSVNGVLKCEKTGDFSASGKIGRVYPQIYLEGAQVSGKTVFIDNFAVDDEPIGSGIPKIFQTAEFFSYVEGSGGASPLQGVKINGTKLTDSSGYYRWSNLTYNTVYTFVVETPANYYPAWVLNVEGSFSYNGTHFVLSHNVTETQTGYIQIQFFGTSQPYIKESDIKIASSSVSNNIMYINTVNASGSKTIKVYSSTRPTYFKGTSYSQSDYASNIFTITYGFSGSKTFTLSWTNLEGIKIYGTDGEVTGTPSYSGSQFSFTINKTSGTSTTQVYVGSLGEPYTVSGASSWSYDSNTQIVTVTASHSSEQGMIIDWIVPSSILTTFRNNYYIVLGFLGLVPLVVGAFIVVSFIKGKETPESKDVIGLVTLAVIVIVVFIIVYAVMNAIIGG